MPTAQQGLLVKGPSAKRGFSLTTFSTCATWSWFTAWAAMAAFSAFFVYYIFATFFTQPVSDWITVQNFSLGLRPVPIAVHWVGGTIVLIVGPVQILSWTRSYNPAIHRWLGRLYVAGALTTCAGGFFYLVACGTYGGVAMDIPFFIYGFLFTGYVVRTWWLARQGRYKQHGEWGVRTFALGLASALYRVLVFPSFVGWWQPSPEAIWYWLVIASYLFYFPLMIAAEVVLWRWRKQKLAADKQTPLMSTA